MVQLGTSSVSLIPMAPSSPKANAFLRLVSLQAIRWLSATPEAVLFLILEKERERENGSRIFLPATSKRHLVLNLSLSLSR